MPEHDDKPFQLPSFQPPSEQAESGERTEPPDGDADQPFQLPSFQRDGQTESGRSGLNLPTKEEPPWETMSILDAFIHGWRHHAGESWRQAFADTFAMFHDGESQKAALNLLGDITATQLPPNYEEIGQDVGRTRDVFEGTDLFEPMERTWMAGMGAQRGKEVYPQKGRELYHRPKERVHPYLQAMADVYAERYGDMTGFKRFIGTDPVGFTSDLAMVIPYIGAAGKSMLPAQALNKLKMFTPSTRMKAFGRGLEAVGDPGSAVGRLPGDAIEAHGLRGQRQTQTETDRIAEQREFTDREAPPVPGTVSNPQQTFLDKVGEIKITDPLASDRMKGFLSRHQNSSLDMIADDMLKSVYPEDLVEIMKAVDNAPYIQNGIRATVLRRLFDNVPATWTPDGLAKAIDQVDPDVLDTILSKTTHENLIAFAEASKKFKDPNRFFKWVRDQAQKTSYLGGTTGFGAAGYLISQRLWPTIISGILGPAAVKALGTGMDAIIKRNDAVSYMFREPTNWANWTGKWGKRGKRSGQASRFGGSYRREMDEQLARPHEIEDPVGLLRGSQQHNYQDLLYGGQKN